MDAFATRQYGEELYRKQQEAELRAVNEAVKAYLKREGKNEVNEEVRAYLEREVKNEALRKNKARRKQEAIKEANRMKPYTTANKLINTYFHTFTNHENGGKGKTILTSVYVPRSTLRNLENLNKLLEQGVKFAVKNSTGQRNLQAASRFGRFMHPNRAMLKRAIQNSFGLEQDAHYRR